MKSSGTPTQEKRFRAPGVTVSLTSSEPGRGYVAFFKETRPCGPSIPVRLVDITQGGAAPHEPARLIRFPGSARHPAGAEAEVSWYNDHGEGWLRIIDATSMIVLPLTGWDLPDEALVVPSHGKRGPPKSMDLWLAIAALLRPSGIDAKEAQLLTGINPFNVYDWLKRSAEAGLLLRVPNGHGRSDQFIVPAPQVPILGEYIRNAWDDWRKGGVATRLRRKSRYFIASREWIEIEAVGKDGVAATGITWLEGHNGRGQAHLSPEGNIPRLTFFCRESCLPEVASQGHFGMRAAPENEYDSEVTILADDHPLWHLIDRPRLPSELWPRLPDGLAVLDATWDHSPRVRDVATKVWSDWLSLVRAYATKRPT